MPLWPSKTKPDARIRAEGRGKRGERLAALYLMAKFYRIRHLRFKSPVGEIDLIATNGQTLVFIEVKTRARAADLETALLAVNQRRIVRAAQYYLSKYPHLAQRDARFDVIFLAPGHWPRHVRNAFQSPE